MNLFVSNLGYIFLIVVVTCICFWQYTRTMNDRAEEQLGEANLTKKERRAKLHARYKNLWLFGAIVVFWLLIVVTAFSDGGLLLALIFTIAAAIGVWYCVYNADDLQTVAFKFLSAPLGLTVGFAIGKLLNLQGIWTYIFGIAGAIVFVAITHYIHFKACDRLDDDEEDEEDDEDDTPATARSANGTRHQGVYRAPRVNSDRPTNSNRRTSEREHDDGDRNFDAYIIEQLSKTEEGRQQLIEMLKRRE